MHIDQENGLKPHFGPFLALNCPWPANLFSAPCSPLSTKYHKYLTYAKTPKTNAYLQIKWHKTSFWPHFGPFCGQLATTPAQSARWPNTQIFDPQTHQMPQNASKRTKMPHPTPQNQPELVRMPPGCENANFRYLAHFGPIRTEFWPAWPPALAQAARWPKTQVFDPPTPQNVSQCV